MWEVACDAFARNFLYTPIAEREFRRIYAPAAAMAPPELPRSSSVTGGWRAFCSPIRTPFGPRGRARDTVVFKTAAVATVLQRHGLGQLLFDASLP